jgi:hypothetical protein
MISVRRLIPDRDDGCSDRPGVGRRDERADARARSTVEVRYLKEIACPNRHTSDGTAQVTPSVVNDPAGSGA